ncbi:MAG: hypothetical protein ACYDHF_06370 [Candidatus Cryosericum sp.]
MGDGQVVIELVGKDNATQAFIRSIQDMQNSVKNLEGQGRGLSGLGQVFDGVRDHWLALVSAFGGTYLISQGVQKFWQSFQENTAAQKALLDLSTRLGASVEDVSGLQFAARRTGVELDSFATGATRLTKNISAAALGTEQATDEFGQYTFAAGKASQALRELGFVSPEQVNALNNLPLKEKLMAIAEAMKQVPSEADKVRIALDLFGKGGGGMVVMLKDGAEGIQQLVDRGKQLGVVLDEGMTKRGAEAAKSLADLKDNVHGLSLNLTDIAAPGIAKFVAGLNQKVEAARADGTATKTLMQITSLFGKVWDEPGLSMLKNGIIGAQLWGVKGAALGAAAGFMGLKLELKDLSTILNDPMLSTLLLAGLGAMAGKTAGIAGAAIGAGAGALTAVGIGIKRDAAKYQREQAKGEAAPFANIGEEMPIWPSDAATKALEQQILYQNSLEKIQGTFGPGTRAKPETGKGGGGGAAGQNMAALMGMIDQLEKEYATFTEGQEAGVDKWAAHMLNRIRGVEEAMKDPASAQARAEELVALVTTEKKKKLELDYNKWLAGIYHDTNYQIYADEQEALAKYANDAQKQEEIKNAFRIKRAEDAAQKESGIWSMSKGYLDSLAGAAPLLAQQLPLKQQALDLEIKIAQTALERDIIEKGINQTDADQLRGLLALTNQAKKFSLEQAGWARGGAVGGYQIWSQQRQQEMETRGSQAFIDGMRSSEDWLGTTFGNAAVDSLLNHQMDLTKIFQNIFSSAIVWSFKHSAQSFVDLLSKFKGGKGGGISYGDVPNVQEWDAVANKWVDVAGQNADAGSLLSASGMSGIAAGASLGLGAIGMMTGSQTLMVAATALSAAATLLEIAGAVGLFHGGGVVAHGGMLVAHRGLAPDERFILAQTGEGIIKRPGMAAYARMGISFDDLNNARLPAVPVAGGGGPAVHHHYYDKGSKTVVVQALDNKSVADFARKHGNAFFDAQRGPERNFRPRSTFKYINSGRGR